MFEAERLSSSEPRGGGWRLGISGRRKRAYTVRASLATLARPLRPCSVTLGGRRLPRAAWSWRPRSKVLTVRFTARKASLRAIGCQP
jgi:hypothetical protein